MKLMSTPNFHRQTEDDPLNYGCLLNDLLKAEKMTKRRQIILSRKISKKCYKMCQVILLVKYKKILD